MSKIRIVEDEIYTVFYGRFQTNSMDGYLSSIWFDGKLLWSKFGNNR